MVRKARRMINFRTARLPRGRAHTISTKRISSHSFASVRDMKLTLRLDPTRLRRWHVRLAGRLAQRADTRVAVEWNGASEPLPSAVALLFSLERLIYRLPPGDEEAARIQ